MNFHFIFDLFCFVPIAWVAFSTIQFQMKMITKFHHQTAWLILEKVHSRFASFIEEIDLTSNISSVIVDYVSAMNEAYSTQYTNHIWMILLYIYKCTCLYSLVCYRSKTHRSGVLRTFIKEIFVLINSTRITSIHNRQTTQDDSTSWIILVKSKTKW